MKQMRNMTEPELRDFCLVLARLVEGALPPGPSSKGKCLFFLTFTETVEPGIGQYVSNVRREDAIKWLREQADRLELRQDVTR